MKKSACLLTIFLVLSLNVFAQKSTASLGLKDYKHAEQFLFYGTAPYVDHGNVSPHWLEDGRFWFRDMLSDGSEYILVDPVQGIRKPAFDQQKVAASLSKATGYKFSGKKLPFHSFEYIDDDAAIRFRAVGSDWKCDLATYECTKVENRKTHQERNIPDGAAVSPDGKKAVFIKDWNLWVRYLSTGKEVQLTKDGIDNFGYATDNASWKHSDKAILKWSPDSKKIATYKQDQRKVPNMYLVSTDVGAPRLEKWKYEFPMDTNQMKIHRVIIEVDTPKVIALNIPPDPRRSTAMDDIVDNKGSLADVQWSQDGSKLAFVSTSRFHKIEKMRIADAATGDVRAIFQENIPMQYESGDGGINWRYLSQSHEIIWFSEKDNWGHLYLYDVRTRRLKNKITQGNYVVVKIDKIDQKKRTIYFTATGLNKENPYFRKLCKVNFDGKGFKILTPESGNHKTSLSPSGSYWIDSYSKPDVPQVTVLRKLSGEKIITLGKEDISRLKASGWKAPIPFTAKAADGKTNIYGLMFTPTNLDPNKKYPVVDYIYPGPQAGTIGDWSFSASRRDNQALAELGFVVVAINGTSNPLRTKSYQDMSYGNMSVNTLPDQITAIKQLAAKYNYIDLDRIGIWGHSGGGFATAAALFRYPDFFKVGIAESGNHDNRNYESDWGDRFNGPISNMVYAAQANASYAKNLRGKLMLVVGLMDNNVPPQNTLLVVKALEDANKDFDLIVYPSDRHGYGKYYFYEMRRRWDYFVKNLMGKHPPEEFQFDYQPDPRNGY